MAVVKLWEIWNILCEFKTQAAYPGMLNSDLVASFFEIRGNHVPHVLILAQLQMNQFSATFRGEEGNKKEHGMHIETFRYSSLNMISQVNPHVFPCKCSLRMSQVCLCRVSWNNRCFGTYLALPGSLARPLSLWSRLWLEQDKWTTASYWDVRLQGWHHVGVLGPAAPAWIDLSVALHTQLRSFMESLSTRCH